MPLWANSPSHMIVTGETGSKQTVDLSSLNRITFGENSMSLSLTDDLESSPIVLPYNLFNHIEFSDDLSTVLENHFFTDAKMLFLPGEKALEIKCDKQQDYLVFIFNSFGALIERNKTTSNTRYYLTHLYPGLYIAVAKNNNNQLQIKFILR